VKRLLVAAFLMMPVVGIDSVAMAEDVTMCSAGGEAWRAGDVQTAIDAFTMCIDEGDLSDTTMSAALSSRGNILVAVGATQHGLEDLNSALQLDPVNAAAAYGRGNARFDQGDMVGALEDYNLALGLQPDLPPLYLARADTFSALGRHAEALADYDRVLLTTLSTRSQ